MRQYILISARSDNGSSVEARRAALQDILAKARQLSGPVFPSLSKERTVEWISPNGQVAALGISNEPEGFDHDITRAALDDVFLGVEGYTITDVDDATLRHSHELLEASQRMGGCFTLYRASDHGISAVTDAAGTGNACHAESGRFRIISNRSLWAHLVAEHDRTGAFQPVLRFDDRSLRSMANSGSVQGTRTLFEGVQLMPRRCQFTATPWNTRQRIIESPIARADESWQPTEADLNAVCESLISAFSPLRHSDLNLSLTGGRDSRMLLAAARHVEGLNLRTATAGEPDNPDVVIAAQLSATLGISHSIAAPPRAAPDVLMSEPIGTRILRVLDGHDWNLSAWDDMPDYGKFSVRPAMSGVGGEGLRGGIVMPGVLTMDTKRVMTSLRNLQAGSPNLFREHVNQAAADDAYRWQELARYDPYEALDRYYKDERSNRWATSRRAAARLRSNVVDPLFDNLFIAAFEQIPASYKWNEKLAFDIIKRLAPEIADAPIEGNPWKFDEQARQAQGTKNPAPGTLRSVMKAAPRDGVKPWRMLDAPSLRSSMRDFIEAHLEGPATNVLNPTGVRAMLEDLDRARPAMLWNLATVSAAMSIRSLDGSREPLRNSVEVRDARGLRT